MVSHIKRLQETYAVTLTDKDGKIVEHEFSKTILEEVIHSANKDNEVVETVLGFVTENIGALLSDTDNPLSIKAQIRCLYRNVHRINSYVAKNGADIDDLELKFVASQQITKSDKHYPDEKRKMLEDMMKPYRDD